jgi:small subunit ribosomal protein S8
MSNQDPISNMLTSIRNAQAVGKAMVIVPCAKIKKAILEVLSEEGYIEGFLELHEDHPKLQIKLKYFEGRPVIDEIQRVSRPALRIYRNKDELPIIDGGLGIAIISTSKGIMTDKTARRQGLGGEVICYVS